MSTEKLQIERIKSMPALFGEVDIVKSLQLLPGVSSAGEGTSGMFVRGGGSDQNLILLDEATVYNASHLLGFFSVFNPDAVKNVEIYDYGLGEKKEKVSLNFNPESTFSTHVSTSTENTKKVNISTLDLFNFTDVDFIKIDAEGFEPFIINGGLKTILKYNPVILYERKGHEKRYGFKKNSVLDILSPYGYKELDYVGSKNALIGVA